MKKTIKFLILIIAIICGILYSLNISLIDIKMFVKTDCFIYKKEAEYQDKYYYNKLNDFEKKVYLLIAKNVEVLDTTIIIFQNKDIMAEDLSKSVNKAREYYLLDNPEIFFFENILETAIYESMLYRLIEIKIDYSNTKEEIIDMKLELNNRVDEIIKNNIKAEMTDYEKEKTVYNYILNSVVYFNYDKKENIPDIKHTSYGALVQGSAVCDGFSKAFKIIMDNINVKTILVLGETTELHAWNIIFLDGEAYHTDVTSGKQRLKEDKYFIHYTYFNLTDEEIQKTHKIFNKEILPKASAIKYNYYYKEDLIIKEGDNLHERISQFIDRSNNSKTLEFKAEGIGVNQIAKALYFLDFENYKSETAKKISYYNNEDVFIVLKNN